MRSLKITRGQLRSQKGCWGPIRKAKVTRGWSTEVPWGWLRSYKVTRDNKRSHKVGWGHMKSNDWRMLLTRYPTRYPVAISGIWPDTGYKKRPDYPCIPTTNAYHHDNDISKISVFRIRIQLNLDPAKNLNLDPDWLPTPCPQLRPAGPGCKKKKHFEKNSAKYNKIVQSY